ncbi:MAG: fibronectin type III domain-containing protein [Patescibacteria group bacterium]
MFKKISFFILLTFIPLYLTGCLSINTKKNTEQTDQKNISNQSTKSTIPLFLYSWFSELEQPIDQRVAFQYKGIPRHPKSPPPPTNINVENPNIGTILNINWTNPKEVVFKNIRIYRSIEKNKIGELLITLDGRTTFYQDKKVERNKNFYYTVRSVISWVDPKNPNNTEDQESDNFDQKLGKPVDKVPPFPPKDVQIIAGQKSGSLLIKWTNPIDEDFNYVQIYKSEAPNKIGMLIGSNIKDVFFQDQGLKDNAPYYYIVTAVDKSGNESLIKLIDVGKINPFTVFTTKEAK